MIVMDIGGNATLSGLLGFRPHLGGRMRKCGVSVVLVRFPAILTRRILENLMRAGPPALR